MTPAARSDADEVLTPAPPPAPRAALTGEILSFCRTAPIGEVQLLHELMRRLLRGRAQYGAWVAANESRDLEREQYEELLDGMVYGAMMRVVEREDAGPTREELRAMASPETRTFLAAIDRLRAGEASEAESLEAFKAYLRAVTP